MKKNKRILAFILCMIMLFQMNMAAWAEEIKDEADDMDQSGQEQSAAGDEDTEKSPEMDSEDEIDPELLEYIREAEDALSVLAGQENLMALVYLCDTYGVKSTPDRAGKTVVQAPSGTTVFMKGVGLDEDNNIWYQISFEHDGVTYSGYIEREYLAYSNELFINWENEYFPQISMFAMTNTDYQDVEQFPESYRQKLILLKKEHPNWIFVRQNTGLDWQTVVNSENYKDRSLISSSMGAAYRGDYYGSGWYYASEQAVKYYLDPRNFLNETRIFQFEQLTYNSSYHSKAAVQNILNSTFMQGALPGAGMTYADAFFQIGVSLKVSPFHLACRVYQEQGEGKSALISGNYDAVPEYKGYYNYYNIGASGSTTTQIVESGLARAVALGWNTPYASIRGGAEILSKNYILRGQDSLYLQKFDVDASDGTLFTHQYMQNIMAPYTEATMVKNAYLKTGSLDSPFVFKIPVYNNMPSEACPVPSQSVAPTATPTPTPTAKATATPTVAPTATPTSTATAKATATPTAAPTATPTATAKATATPTAAPTATPTATAKATAAPTARATTIPTIVPTPTSAPTASALPEVKATATPVATATPTPATIPTAKATTTPTVAPTKVPIPTASAVPTATPTPTANAAPTATPTPTATPIPTATTTPTSAPTATPVATPTTMPTATPAVVPAAAPTAKPEGNSGTSSSSGESVSMEAAPAAVSTEKPEGVAAASEPAVVKAEEDPNSAKVTVAAVTPKPQTAAESEDVLTMDMSKTGIIYAQTLQQIKDQGRTVILKVGDKARWTIDGSRIERDDLEDVNLKVTFGNSRIPKWKLEVLTENENYVEMTLEHEGEFGFTTVLSVQLDNALPGQYANLFYYNEETEDFEYMCASLISSKNVADFEFWHASDYVIIISDDTKENLLEIKAGDMAQAQAQELEAMVQAKEELPAKEPGKAAGIIAIILLVSAALVIGAFLIFKRDDDK